MTRAQQSVLSLCAAFVFFCVIAAAYPPSTTPRPQWPIAFGLILCMLGFVGGADGAALGHFAIGFIAGVFLPIVAFFVFGIAGALC